MTKQIFSSEEKSKIIETLTNRGVNRPCPRCNKKDFSLLDGYFNHPLLTEAMLPTGSSAPSLITLCVNCGYMSHHALGILVNPTSKNKDVNNQ